MTLPQSSAVQSLYLLQNISLSLMFFLESSGFFAALLDTRPYSKSLYWWWPDPQTLGDGVNCHHTNWGIRLCENVYLCHSQNFWPRLILTITGGWRDISQLGPTVRGCVRVELRADIVVFVQSWIPFSKRWDVAGGYVLIEKTRQSKNNIFCLLLHRELRRWAHFSDTLWWVHSSWLKLAWIWNYSAILSDFVSLWFSNSLLIYLLPTEIQNYKRVGRGERWGKTRSSAEPWLTLSVLSTLTNVTGARGIYQTEPLCVSKQGLCVCVKQDWSGEVEWGSSWG